MIPENYPLYGLMCLLLGENVDVLLLANYYFQGVIQDLYAKRVAPRLANIIMRVLANLYFLQVIMRARLLILYEGLSSYIEGTC